MAAIRPVRSAAPAVGKAEAGSAWLLQLAFVLAHAPLALAIPKHSRLGTLHALLVFGVGVLVAVMPRRPHLVACATAYITGAAVLWRMKAAPDLPWEFGKYAIIALFGIALVFSVRIRRPVLPLAYLLLLLPSAMLTISNAPWDDAREALSFNLSGPIALAFAVLFFGSVRLSPEQMRWVCTSLLAPIFGIGAFAAYNLQKALQDPEFEFYGGSSNATASGGFGPNQVSAALGLGIVAAFLYLLLGVRKKAAAAPMILLILFLARQTLITLSRGGVYMSIGAVAAASIFLVRDSRVRGKLLLAAAGVAAVLLVVVIPRLDALTGGVLVNRMENTSGTGRELLIKADMESWASNPLLGVGPGMGGAARLKYFHVPTAHTEYTRLWAEHGLLGFIATILLGAMALRAVRQQTSLRARAVSAALLAYALLFMAVDAMRLAAPALVFGLACALIAGPRPAPAPAPEPRPRPASPGLRSPNLRGA